MVELSAGPLAGVTVVTLEHALAAPFASRQLADLGARVIKVERPGGDFARGYDDAIRGELSSVFMWIGRGKESIVLDLKTEEGKDAFEKLLARADVFLHNMSPGAVDRLGFGADRLRRDYPRLILVSNSGYGSPGPYAGKRAYDSLVQAEAGLVAMTATQGPPTRAGFSAADVAGGMYMFAAVASALYQRERTGQGTVIEIAMFDALTDWIASHIYFAQHTGRAADPVTLGHPSLSPYGGFPTADGGLVVIGVQNDREWLRLCEVLFDDPSFSTTPEYATNIERNRRRQEVDDLVASATQTRTTAVLQAELDDANIANAQVRSVMEAADHPQHAARDRWVEVDSPVGSVRTFRSVIQESGKEFTARPIPALGEHTEAILAELRDNPTAAAD